LKPAAISSVAAGSSAAGASAAGASAAGASSAGAGAPQAASAMLAITRRLNKAKILRIFLLLKKLEGFDLQTHIK
jgi:hypothetical protein